MDTTLEEYMRELFLMKRQYGQEEELYPLVNMLLRENDNVKHLSVRDVHDSRASGLKHDMLYGYASFPDIVILDEKYGPKEFDYNKMYGCVEAKVEGKLVDFEYGEKLILSNIKLCGYAFIGYGSGNSSIKNEHKEIINDIQNKDMFKRFEHYTIVDDLEAEGIFEELKDIEGIERIKKIINMICGKEEKNKFEGIDIQNEKNEKKISLYLNEFLQLSFGSKELCEIENVGLTQVIGELLWYGKVLYTDGVIWKYLELKHPDKSIIYKELNGCMEENDENWVEKLAKHREDEKNETPWEGLDNGKELHNPITVMCVEIGNLSSVYNALVKNDEDDKIYYLRKILSSPNKDTDDWQRAWDRLKINLSHINWIGENSYFQFI